MTFSCPASVRRHSSKAELQIPVELSYDAVSTEAPLAENIAQVTTITVSHMQNKNACQPTTYRSSAQHGTQRKVQQFPL